jgi:hypothetical protein
MLCCGQDLSRRSASALCASRAPDKESAVSLKVKRAIWRYTIDPKDRDNLLQTVAVGAGAFKAMLIRSD